MAYDDVADAESLDDDYYEDEYYDDDDNDEEDLLFGRIPRTPGLIAIFSLLVVVLLLLAALVSTSFGFRSGITYLDVAINADEDDLESTQIQVNGLTGTPSFGKNADGNGDLFILYKDEEVYATKIKFNDGRANKYIPYSNFYVDNGDYLVRIDFEGESSQDTVTVKRTAHDIVIAQRNFTTGYKDDERDTREGEVVYKLSLFTEVEESDERDLSDTIFTIGTAELVIYYVNDEDEQDDREEYWQEVGTIDFTSDFSTYIYEFGNIDENASVDLGGYQLRIPQEDIMADNGEGYYTIEAIFTNNYGLEEAGAFRDPIINLPEDSFSKTPNGEEVQESYEWLFLEEFD